MKTFTLTDEEQARVNTWVRELIAKRGSDYFGAIGGELTYSFTPTSLGMITIVHFCKGTQWAAELNLTDYDSW